MSDVTVPEKINVLSEELERAYLDKQCRIAYLAGWELNFNTMCSRPPPGFNGFAPTNYCYFNPDNREELRAVCRDFIRCAIYSIRLMDKRLHIELATQR